jgi:hypothetical protein
MWRTNFRNREKLVICKGIIKIDVMCSASMKTLELKTLHPMAGRSEAPIRHRQVAHTIPLTPG